MEPQVPDLYASLHGGDAGASRSLLRAHAGRLEVDAAPGGEHRPADRAQDALAVADAGRGQTAERGPAVAGDRGASGGGSTGPGPGPGRRTGQKGGRRGGEDRGGIQPNSGTKPSSG